MSHFRESENMPSVKNIKRLLSGHESISECHCLMVRIATRCWSAQGIHKKKKEGSVLILRRITPGILVAHFAQQGEFRMR